MNYERSFEIECERSVGVTYNHQHLCFGWIFQAERSNFALCDAHLVVWDESSRTYNAQGNLRTINALQPGKCRILRVAQQHPPAAIFHTDEPVDKCQDVGFIDHQIAEACRGDVHD